MNHTRQRVSLLYARLSDLLTGTTLRRYLSNSCRVLVLCVRPYYAPPSRISMRIVVDAVTMASRCCTPSVERFRLASVHFYDRASTRASSPCTGH